MQRWKEEKVKIRDQVDDEEKGFGSPGAGRWSSLHECAACPVHRYIITCHKRLKFIRFRMHLSGADPGSQGDAILLPEGGGGGQLQIFRENEQNLCHRGKRKEAEPEFFSGLEGPNQYAPWIRPLLGLPPLHPTPPYPLSALNQSTLELQCTKPFSKRNNVCDYSEPLLLARDSVTMETAGRAAGCDF